MYLRSIRGSHLQTLALRPERRLLYQTVAEHDEAWPETKPPCITPARWPPLWDGADAQVGYGVDVGPDWDEAAQTAPDFELDQRVSW